MCFVAYAHPHKGGFTPVSPLSVRETLGYSYLWYSVSDDRNAYVWVVDASAIDAPYKFFGIIMIEFIDYVTDANIGT